MDQPNLSRALRPRQKWSAVPVVNNLFINCLSAAGNCWATYSNGDIDGIQIGFVTRIRHSTGVRVARWKGRIFVKKLDDLWTIPEGSFTGLLHGLSNPKVEYAT